MPVKRAVDEIYIAAQAPMQRALLEKLRPLVIKGVPGAEVSMKWGVPFYATAGKPVCALASFKEHVGINFFASPDALVDPAAKLEGAGKTSRMLKVRTAADIDKTAIARWLKAASAKRGPERMSALGAPKDVDAYLARLPVDQRVALSKLRRTINAAAPGMVGSISYGVATYKFDGKPVVYFGAAKAHCAIYGPAISRVEKGLEGFDRSKGTVRFTPDKPLPAALVSKLVRARVAEIKAGGR